MKNHTSGTEMLQNKIRLWPFFSRVYSICVYIYVYIYKYGADYRLSNLFWEIFALAFIILKQIGSLKAVINLI